MSPIPVTLTSRSHPDFEPSNISLKENNRNDVDLSSNGLDYCVRKNQGKFYGSRQTGLDLSISNLRNFPHHGDLRAFSTRFNNSPEVCYQ